MSQDCTRTINRVQLERKKRELEAEFGCRFHTGNSSFPLEVEWDWLQYIQEFERQYRRNRQTTVRQFIGDPPIQSLESLPSVRIDSELERLLDLLAAHSIVVHWTTPLSPAEMYRFLIDELFEEEIDDIRIPGMTHNFVYEEFHPEPDDRIPPRLVKNL